MITAPLVLVGLIFLAPGLDMLAFHALIPRPPEGMGIPYYIGAVMFALTGGFITLTAGKRVIRPTILLAVSPEGISFAEGLYSNEIFRVEWSHFERAGYGLDSKLLSAIPVSFAGLVIRFRPFKGENIRTDRWTDMGVGYVGSTLCINRWCMDTSIER